MTDNQKRQVVIMRERGETYASIAEVVKVSQNTVKSYCLRHDIRIGGGITQPTYQIGDITSCEQCGQPVVQYSLLRKKRFCCDACRNTWWNRHPNLVNRRSVYEHTCQHCGKPFQAYGNARRKYCSHACYIAARFGGSNE